jgi:soluble lytic murein transglycosylase-like protein
MKIRVVACTAMVAALPFFAAPVTASANSSLDALIVKHAAAYNVPESLVRRVIKRESGGRPHVVSKGNYGLMQIRLGTARGMGYRGDARGLLDADTNMTYAVKYLAGAYKVAGGNHDRAVSLYASGYYYAAKRQGMLAQVNPNAGLGVASLEQIKGQQAFASASGSAEAQPASFTVRDVKGAVP